MKKINQTLISPIGRTLIYLTVFIAGSALLALLFQFINFATRYNIGIILVPSYIATFVLIGAIFACQRHTMSRVASAATLFILAFISLRMESTFVPISYLLVIAFGVAAIGAQPVFHRKLTSVKKMVFYSILTILISLVVAATFTYGMFVIDRIILSHQNVSQIN